MFNKIMLYILEKAYEYHKIREVRHYDLAYWALMVDIDDKAEARHFKKYVYHNERCAQIDKLIYAIEGP